MARGEAAELFGDGAWALASGEVDGSRLHALPDGEVTLALVPGDGQARIAGRAACNRYSARVDVAGGTVTVPPELVTTLMMCAPEVMALERAYLAALPRVTRGRRAGETLVLEGDGVSLRFAAAPGA